MAKEKYEAHAAGVGFYLPGPRGGVHAGRGEAAHTAGSRLVMGLRRADAGLPAGWVLPDALGREGVTPGEGEVGQRLWCSSAFGSVNTLI